MIARLLRGYTTAVLRARDEYHRHPIAACIHTRCDHMRVDGELLCTTHIRDRDRMRRDAAKAARKKTP